MTATAAETSPRKAAIVVGIAILAMFVLAIVVDEFVLPNFIGPGDTAALARDMEVKEARFGLGVIGYLLILILDAVIALALYVILKPANKILASLTAVLRLLYAAILVISVLALVLRFIDAYSYGTVKLIGYVFFTAHIFVLGYAVFKSAYMPRSLGVLLIIASLCYVVLLFGSSMVPEKLLPIFVVPAALAELLLGIWLLWKRAKIPATISSS
ncbi:MAG: DUF4386 domain-containing protein [Candidatus Coatesbacteria bacterium]|nr:MAG: DUF4386 domain-containing protein [Candidatus Coatesbacteria bacterium]